MSTNRLSDINDQWELKLKAKSWAFGIWAVIYFLLAIFAVYQALPDKWVPSRNNELIFGQIKYVFFVNMIMNGLWLVIFLQNTGVSMAFGTLDILAMVATQVYMLMKITRAKCNMVEIITLRIGFSLYTGWVTAASIINVTFFLKAVGMKNENAGFSETTWCVIVFYVALVIYVLASLRERNPLYGAVYIWVLFAVKDERVNNHNIQVNTLINIIIMALAVVGITGLSVYEKMNGKCEKGLFY